LIAFNQGATAVKLTTRTVYDFTKYVFRKTAGKSAIPEAELVRQISEEKSPDLDALSEAIDTPLKEAHRTISQGEGTTTIGSRSADLVKFNAASLEYLTRRVLSGEIEEIRGNVAAFNVNSQKGRFFDAELGRTVPFEPANDSNIQDPSPLSWSLDQRNRGFPGDIAIGIRRVMTVKNETKKYLLYSCRQIES